MARTITFSIQKGGVGKTSTAVIIAYLLSTVHNKRVLCVDFDSQGNMTYMLTQRNIYDFTGKTAFEAVKELDPTPYIINLAPNLDLLPAEDNLATLPRFIYTAKLKTHMAMLLSKTLEKVRDKYDWIIIDLPPNPGDQTINGLAAADYVVAMFQTEPFCYRALQPYMNIISDVREKLNPNLWLLGIAPALTDVRVSMDTAVLDMAEAEYGDALFTTVLHRKSRVKEWSELGVTWNPKDRRDKAAMPQYVALLEEVIQRVQAHEDNQ